MTASLSAPPGAPVRDERVTTADGLLTAPHKEPTRALEFILGAAVLVPWVPPGAPQFFSLGLVALVALVGMGAMRRPVIHLGGLPYRLGWLLPLLIATLVWLVAISLSSPDASLSGWEKRALRLVLVAFFLVFLVAGRIHYPSVVRGAAFGLLGNAVLFYADLAPSPYGDYLSGFLLDKNQAGFICAVVGLLFAGLQQSRFRTAMVLAVTSGLVWTTGSRTSLAGFVCGIAWIFLAPRLARGGRLLLAAALVAFVEIATRDFSQVGVFADRDGTDALRQRIDAASEIKLGASPPWGQGLGEAYVYLDGRVFFFHNSYWAALLEGGWVLAAVYVGVTLFVGVGLLRRTRVPTVWVAAEAANIAVLVCALRLGEVFGTATAMLTLAAGMLALAARAHAVRRSGSETTDGKPLSERLEDRQQVAR